MEVSDSDYENVVLQIFDNLGYGVVNIPTNTIMELITPYLGNNISEYAMLREILDPYSMNCRINKNDLKSALLRWTENLKCPMETCLIQDNSMSTNYDASEHLQYSSGSSISSQSYRERIAELQNEVAEREYAVCRLKTQLDIAVNQTQLHEEALAGLTQDRDQLRTKLSLVEQQNTLSVATMKQEYEDLMDTLNSFREKLKVTTNNLDNLKKQNSLLSNNIAELDNEKHSLSMMLSKSNKDKNKVVSLLSAAETDIAVLKSECVQFKDRIQEQEKTINHLTSVNNSLEINLQNTSLLCRSHQRQAHSCDENSNDGSAILIDKYDFRTVSIKRDDRSSALFIRDTSKEKEARSEAAMTSTPRNRLSLMQEFSGACENVSTAPPIDYNNFKFTLDRLNSAQAPACRVQENIDSSVINNIEIQSPLNIGNSCQHTYVLDDDPSSERMKGCEIDWNDRINALQRELIDQREFNVSIGQRFIKNNEEMMEMKRTVDAFKNQMVVIRSHEMLLGLNVWSIRRKLTTLRYDSEEHSRPAEHRIKEAEMFLESGTQTECGAVIGKL